MRFSVAAVLAIATSVFAQTDGFDVITNPYAGEKVLAGKPCEIKWAPSTEPKFQGTVRIDVLGGTTPQTLDKVGTVATGVDSSKGSYKWNVDPHLGTENTYGIQITLESNKEIYQYSFPFHIIGGLPADDDETTTIAIPTTTATGTAKPLTLTAPTTTKAATTTAAAETTSAAGSSDSDSSASGAVSSFSTVVSSSSASVEASSTFDTVATPSASTTGAVVTGGAAAFGASTGVVLGGVAMALFAL
ncbi:Ser-Thr-rich glycosyl-phosphatidyl-inositol-anchored membrane family-domain-containing protein [Sordaria brevicollis]|uniref:Ser-Thr-rich glycosyl-phosphatidyl-inositol-anchored membrane family-domain-containing protein n=1 Tax=Sordaria brevicollis TaxID=83679 RepID=A0AAE0PDU7_SORBR|nr:Ser-Thr-rich glycosyl-phosphatidyl-inositol-anchored membrane family-domain-containing protein [Sordaria brevicollis]